MIVAPILRFAFDNHEDLLGIQSVEIDKSIPATVLLDRDGIIVAKNLRGDALREKLEELYAEELKNS